MIRPLLSRAAAILLGALAIAYLTDTVVFSHRVSTNSGTAFGSVEIYYTTPLKGSRFEFFNEQPQTVSCAHALFPHNGVSPCWYVSRHKMQQIN
jgi:hypothetical protein